MLASQSSLHASDRELSRFHFRVVLAALAVLLALSLLGARFYYLQVVQHDYYSTRAEDNRISVVPIVPNRGVIVDRAGIVLARNYSAFTLEITPSNVEDLEATIDGLSTLIDIEAKDKRLQDAKGKAYIFFHNDGAIYPTLPLLIEAGVDIINPWQVNCSGMGDTAQFKREYGRDLTVWGGSCDTQRVLPFGTPDEVRAETRRRIEDLAPGGGFVFAPIHVIQSDVPTENIVAWWETWQEYGKY